MATTLELIEAEGGSGNVNLRQISRRMGCAHTNVYNYYPSFQSLIWDAFRKGLDIYARYLTRDLSSDLTPQEYLGRTIVNLATFPEKHPGLYRFIASDPLDSDEIPEDIVEYATGMKEWLSAAFGAAAGSQLSTAEARSTADIVLAYIDGETLNLINGREVPSDHLRDRIVGNAIRLFTLLAQDGAVDLEPTVIPIPPPEPSLIFAKRRNAGDVTDAGRRM